MKIIVITVLENMIQSRPPRVPAAAQDPLLAEWIRRSVVIAPTRLKSKLPNPPVMLPEGNSQSLLSERSD